MKKRSKNGEYDESKPTQYLLDSLKKSEEEAVISFKTGKDALNYLDEMIAKDKQNKKSTIKSNRH